MKKKIKVAVIGVGYLGKFHAQKYAALPQAQLVAVCDTQAEQAQLIANQLHVPALLDYKTLVGRVDAVSIATPTPSHHAIARFFLEQGIHVLVEKPIASTLAEADDLVTLSTQQQLILQVGHIERFNNVTKAVMPWMNNPRFIETSRLAPFKLRGSDVSVVLDMMIHDIDIVFTLIKSPLQRVSAIGSSVLSPFADIANARLEFNDGRAANLTVSRINPRISRRMNVFQQDSLFNVDFQRKKLTIQRKVSDEFTREQQRFAHGDPLQEQIIAFLTAVATGQPPVVSAQEGRQALATAIQINDIITMNSTYAT